MIPTRKYIILRRLQQKESQSNALPSHTEEGAQEPRVQDRKRLVLGAGIGKEESLGCQEAIAMAEGVLGRRLAHFAFR